MTPNPHSAMYAQGFDAYIAGELYKDCPYVRGTYARAQWCYGYDAAVKRYRQLAELQTKQAAKKA